MPILWLFELFVLNCLKCWARTLMTRTLMRTGNQLHVQGSIVFNQNTIKYHATDVYTPYELNFSNWARKESSQDWHPERWLIVYALLWATGSDKRPAYIAQITLFAIAYNLPRRQFNKEFVNLKHNSVSTCSSFNGVPIPYVYFVELSTQQIRRYCE